MGARLLTRSGQTTRPTRAGTTILERTRRLLSDARDLSLIAKADVLTGQLRIGAIATAVTGILPPILSALAEQYPQLDVYVMPGASVDLYQKVLTGELDAAILVEPPFDLPKACNWMLLRKEPLILISPQTTPISDAHALLRDKPFIRYDRNHWGGRLADAYLRQAKITPRDRFELDALDAIAIMVASGLGVSLVPDWARPWPENLALNKLTIDTTTFARRIGLLWMRNSTSLRLVKIFQAQTRSLRRKRP